MSPVDYDELLQKKESNVPAPPERPPSTEGVSRAGSDYEKAKKYVAKVPGSPEGQRNQVLNALAFGLCERFPGLAEDGHRQLCLEFNARCTPPLSEREAVKTLKSGWDGCHRKGLVGSKQKPPRRKRKGKQSEATATPAESFTPPEERWPASLGEDAFYGLAGDVVRLIEPHTESDITALLVQFLVAFGNVIDRRAHWVVGGDSHFGNIFAVLVGRTGRGRKGTSWGEIRRLFRGVDETWIDNHIKSGLSSGEGLIWAVRDPVYIANPESGKNDILDPGIEDKRLLAVEEEFAQVLRQCERSGNTLSPIIRKSWENGSLASLTKNSGTRATNAHISSIGHITKRELLKYLTTTEGANGFANRFLWVCVKRSKLLPDGGNLRDSDLYPLRERIREAVEAASRCCEPIRRDDEANTLWHEVYEELTAEREGLAAAVCGRAEAQAMRLAMLYALLDISTTIRVQHLRAGLAVWRYCEDSAECIFGSSLGDATADTISEALRRTPHGLTRTEISQLFKGHKAAQEIERALGVLQSAGLVASRRETGSGRTAERWFWHENAPCE